jgi:hypothetical protein
MIRNHFDIDDLEQRRRLSFALAARQGRLAALREQWSRLERVKNAVWELLSAAMGRHA